MLSQHADESYVLELLKHGASGLGYLLKERVGDRDKQCTHSSRRTAAARSSTPSWSTLSSADVNSTNTPPLADLTARELDVLQEMAQGRSNAAIAERLYLSESSIEKHVSMIFSKLGLTDEPHSHRRVAAVVAYLNAARS